uniref:Uncharacterized protein n=1 Tax=Esox lucius TaxID=8010 RepID=A0AAY5KEU5_ESOLU
MSGGDVWLKYRGILRQQATGVLGKINIQGNETCPCWRGQVHVSVCYAGESMGILHICVLVNILYLHPKHSPNIEFVQPYDMSLCSIAIENPTSAQTLQPATTQPRNTNFPTSTVAPG